METWKDIPGTDYSVSDEGRVASRKYGKWRIVRQTIGTAGYLGICLWDKNVGRMCLVHRLVAEAFLGPPPTPAHEVNHKNGIRTDPRSANLEWVTHSENMRHSYGVLGVKSVRGERNGASKLTEAEARTILARCAAGELQRVVAADYGINVVTVGDIARGKSWAHLGAPPKSSVIRYNGPKAP